MTELRYLSGFGNTFESEAVSGALPIGRNNPQKPPLGLYAEQLSGAAFTAPHAENQRSWLYRILPSVVRSRHSLLPQSTWRSGPFDEVPASPDQLRWDPLPKPAVGVSIDFVDSLFTMCGNGDAASHSGSAVHIYSCNRSMVQRAVYNADGDLLIVPQRGALCLVTEFGRLTVAPHEIAVIQRGIVFRVELMEGDAYGYVCENYGEHFQLPYRGPIGANGLANARDFQTPVAAFEQPQGAAATTEIVVKFRGRLFAATQNHSPFDVVAWHGNYAPYKYDLRRFNTMNSVSFDHPDPSIFTVLTSPTSRAGTANIDFVIFPPRWMVAENTFRPPYYHRNIMSEYMGLIHGVYDAKTGGGFVPGGGSLHNCMAAHGPDADAFAGASAAALTPQYLSDTLAFMFESSHVYAATKQALATPALQQDYASCWQGLAPQFRGTT